MPDVDLSKLSILVVDDEPFVRGIIVRMLTELGYKNIHEADDSVKAAKHLLDAKPPINLVVLDLKMPKIGGIEPLTYIRSAKEFNNRHISVIVLSGHADANNVRAAAKLGIHGFLAKPVSKVLLDTQIKKAISLPPIDFERLKNE